MKITLLGFTVPEDVFQNVLNSDSTMSTQTHLFAWSLVKSLRSGGADVDLISVVPVSNFPGNRKMLWMGRRFETSNGSGIILPFINLFVLKHISRSLSCYLIAWPRLKRRMPAWLLVHGVHSPFLWFAVSLRTRDWAPRVAVVLTDPPGVTLPGDGRFARSLKRFDTKLVRWAVGRVDAVISVAEGLSSDYAPTVPALVMEGICAVPGDYPSSKGDGRNLVVYAGGLSKVNGIHHLLEAVAASDLQVELRIFGEGPERELVERYSDADPRIVGPTLVGRSELLNWYSAADVLVQPRPVEGAISRNSFPSKLIEYLAVGKTVVSTRLESIPSDYGPYVVWAEPSGVSGLRAALARALDMSEADRTEFGARAGDFIRRTRSPEAQGARMVNFLRDRVASP